MNNRLAVLIVVFITTAYPAVAKDSTAPNRDADRAAIRAHIEKIFQAYVDMDCKTIRSTHSDNWIGFTTRAREIVHGIDGYMSFVPACQAGAKRNPDAAHMTSYKILSIDYEFYGDIALVPYTAETNGNVWTGGRLQSIDIYRKQGHDWIQVGSNIFAVPDAPPK
ncbi:MAG TPA: nuclear transport factor 2 family protein [Thermoanaerobaculia bacterium]